MSPARTPDYTFLSYNNNSINFLSFVAKDGVHKINKHLLFHRGSDAGRLLPWRTCYSSPGGDSCSESEASDSYNRGNLYSDSYLSLNSTSFPR